MGIIFQRGKFMEFKIVADSSADQIILKEVPFSSAPLKIITNEKEYVDNVSGEIKRIWDLMNTSYDNFVRTTDPNHEKVVQHIFK